MAKRNRGLSRVLIAYRIVLAFVLFTFVLSLFNGQSATLDILAIVLLVAMAFALIAVHKGSII